MDLGAWLSEVPLFPADGPYLVIVEQPKQVSEPEVFDGLGFGDKWGGYNWQGKPLRLDGWLLLVCWAGGVQETHYWSCGQ